MAVLMLSSVAAFAQRPVGSLTVQPKIGMNFATLTKADDSESRIGLVAGAELEYQISDIFSISGGALYSQQGCEWSEDGRTETNKLDYINIPVLANVYVVKNLAVKVGVQPAFNVNSKAKASQGDSSIQGSIEGIKTFDFSIPIGLSYTVFPSPYRQDRNERRYGADGWSVGIIVSFVTNRSADPIKVCDGGKKVA